MIPKEERAEKGDRELFRPGLELLKKNTKAEKGASPLFNTGGVMIFPATVATLTIPSELRMLPVARCFIEAVCLANNLDKATAHAVVLAACEATSNVIRHAHQNRPEAQLQIQCSLSSDQVAISLTDEGEPFDLDAVPHMDPGEIRVGGRGVFLMRALMDELTCRHRPEGGNILSMVKRLDGNYLARECG